MSSPWYAAASSNIEQTGREKPLKKRVLSSTSKHREDYVQKQTARGTRRPRQGICVLFSFFPLYQWLLPKKEGTAKGFFVTCGAWFSRACQALCSFLHVLIDVQHVVFAPTSGTPLEHLLNGTAILLHRKKGTRRRTIPEEASAFSGGHKRQ